MKSWSLCARPPASSAQTISVDRAFRSSRSTLVSAVIRADGGATRRRAEGRGAFCAGARTLSPARTALISAFLVMICSRYDDVRPGHHDQPETTRDRLG